MDNRQVKTTIGSKLYFYKEDIFCLWMLHHEVWHTTYLPGNVPFHTFQKFHNAWNCIFHAIPEYIVAEAKEQFLDQGFCNPSFNHSVPIVQSLII